VVTTKAVVTARTRLDEHRVVRFTPDTSRLIPRSAPLHTWPSHVLDERTTCEAESQGVGGAGCGVRGGQHIWHLADVPAVEAEEESDRHATSEVLIAWLCY